jgi:nucleotide-binding universal stress UspA family protein
MMGRIVVGIDGSEDALKALRWALDEAKVREASVHLVHSWTFPPMPPLGPDGIPHGDLLQAAEQVLDDAVAKIGTGHGVEITREIANDPPAQALIRASKDAEMVVIGSRGVGGFTGLLLGSVSHQVASHAVCPVVIVPHDERGR